MYTSTNVEEFGSRRFGFVKGQYYWEMQIGPYVIMWKHDDKYQSSDTRCVYRNGRLVIWWDTAWKFGKVTMRRARRTIRRWRHK